MKTIKRVLAVLLALAIAFALALPAMAQSPIAITPLPPAARIGESITLTAHVPEDFEGYQGYQWYQWVDGEWQKAWGGAGFPGTAFTSLEVTAELEDFVSKDLTASLNNLLSGLAKRYKVVVFHGGKESEQEIAVKFFPGYLDYCRGLYETTWAIVTGMFGSSMEPSALYSAIKAAKGITAPLMFPPFLLMGLFTWFGSAMNYTYEIWASNQ